LILVTITGSLYLIFILGPDKTILDMMPGIVLLGAGWELFSLIQPFNFFYSSQGPGSRCGLRDEHWNQPKFNIGNNSSWCYMILGGFGSLTMNNQSYSASQLNIHLDKLARVLGLGNQTSEEIDALPTLLNYKKVNATKDAFIVVTIVLSIGLLSSLLIPLKKPSKMHE
jgi:hypothetical protein